MRRFVSFLAVCVTLGSTSDAQDRFEVPVTGEVLPGWVMADGTRMAALRLTLAPGWKTYWRAPGDAGIPPDFDWSASRNLDGITVDWPAPKVFEQNGMRSVGYEDNLVIPLHIFPNTDNRPVTLKATLHMGICSDICVPHTMQFDADIGTDNATPTPAIAAALAQRPYSANEAGVTSARCKLSPTADGLRVEAQIDMPPAGGTEHVVIEPGQSNIWVSEAKTQRSGDSVTARSDMVSISGGPIALDRSAIRITVLGSNYAVDVKGCSAG